MSEKKAPNKGIALKAGVWYVISNILVRTIAIITTPIFTRLLTTAEYGEVSTFVSWHSMLLPVYTLNLTYSIGRAKLDFPDQLDNYIGAMQVLSAIVSAGISVLALIFVKPLSGWLELSALGTVLLIVYLFFGPAIQMYQNGYRYRYRYKQNIAIAWYISVGTTLLSLALILMGGEDANRADLRMIGMTAPTVALSLYFWLKSARRRTLKVSKTYWTYGLKISLPLVLHTISLHILSQSDRVFITKMWGKEFTGLYSLAYTYGMLLHVLTSAIAESWLPWFHDTYYEGNHHEIRKNVVPLVVFGCFVSLAAIALAPEAVLVLGGKKYAPAVYCVPPVVLGVVCQYIYTHYVNIELHLKRTHYVSGGTIFAACLNLLLNWIFIPIYGFIAAAYTTLASYFALMVIHCVITHKALKVKLYNDLFMFGAMFVTAAVTALLAFTYDHPVIRYSLIGAGFISFLLYFRNYIKNWLRRRKHKKQVRAAKAAAKAEAAKAEAVQADENQTENGETDQ